MSDDTDMAPPEKSTELHAGLDAKKKTTRVNLAIAIAVVAFLLIGAALVVYVMFNPPQQPGDGTF